MLQVLLQDERMVLGGVLRSVEQRHGPCIRNLADKISHGLRTAQLLRITAAELLPPRRRIGVIPRAQGGRGRNVPGPDIVRQGLLRTPRGQSLSTSTRQPSSGAGAS